MDVKARSRQGVSPELLPLFEFSNIVNSSFDLQFILSTVLLTTMGKMLVSKGIVFLRKPEGAFEIVSARGIDLTTFQKTLNISRPIRTISKVDRLSQLKFPWIVPFVNENQKLLIPMVSDGKVVGL
ncbi:MAG: hypothetical protein AAB269_04655, partial [Bacteroidota bacterium]